MEEQVRQTEALGAEAIKFAEQYKGTDKYNVALLGIEEGVRLSQKYAEMLKGFSEE